jgi:hypothetical protein
MSGGRADFRVGVSKTPPYVILSNASAKLIFRTVSGQRCSQLPSLTNWSAECPPPTDHHPTIAGGPDIDLSPSAVRMSVAVSVSVSMLGELIN